MKVLYEMMRKTENKLFLSKERLNAANGMGKVLAWEHDVWPPVTASRWEAS